MAAAPKPPSLPFGSTWTQMFPPKPEFTEKDIPDLSDKVFIVTGSNTGIGKEVASILYSKNAKVYMAARSQEKAEAAIKEVEAKWSESKGKLVFMPLDLADLSTIKASVAQFTDKESQLHGLINNAGVQAPHLAPPHNVTAQGHEIHLGVNVLGNFLFTKLLTPTLLATAETAAPASVRVVWVSSLGAELGGEEGKGISAAYEDYWPQLAPLQRYGVSKAGNWLYAVEFARRYGEGGGGVLSVPCNPGNLNSDLYRDGSLLFKAFVRLVTYPCVNGAYTELFCALSPKIGMGENGDWVVPWGRHYPIRADLEAARKSEAEGGNGHSSAFWAWSEEQVKEFV